MYKYIKINSNLFTYSSTKECFTLLQMFRNLRNFKIRKVKKKNLPA